MPNTANGVPYPAATDLVQDGAAAIQGVAQALDARVLASGITFGPVGGTTRLHSPSGGLLKTDGDLKAASSIEAHAGTSKAVFAGYVPSIGFAAGISFGASYDASLYRSAPNTLETPGTLNVGGLAIAFGIGGRALEVGAPDSGGSGYRMIRVTN